MLKKLALSRLQPYAKLARMDKPAGTLLLFLPCSWSLGMSAFSHYSSIDPVNAVYTGALFACGAFVMRGAGCTINDLWDKDLDRRVARTRDRPLASGQLSTRQALVFLSMQLSAGLGILVQFNPYTIALGATSLVPVVLYPLMKRITYWPQLFLGLTFNWGALLGSAALVGVTDWAVAMPLYFSGVCWTLLYDTIYALQDKKCDAVAGIKSSALAVDGSTKKYLTAFAIGHVTLLGVAGWMNGHSLLFYLVSVGGSAFHCAWQIFRLNPSNTIDAARKFKSNVVLGVLVTLGISADTLLGQ